MSLVQGREDARGELRRAASVDELEHGVQIDSAVLGKVGGEIGSEPGREQAPAPPFHNRVKWGWLLDCPSTRHCQVGVLDRPCLTYADAEARLSRTLTPDRTGGTAR